MVEGEEALNSTAFRSAEKKYQLHRTQKLQFSKGRLRGKGWVEKETDFSEVIDVRGCDEEQLQRNGLKRIPAQCTDQDQKIYSLENHPGFYLLPGALTPKEQFRLLELAWLDFPNPPARTNLFNQYGDVPDLFEAAAAGLHLKVTTDEKIPMDEASSPAGATAESNESRSMPEVCGHHSNLDSCKASAAETDAHERRMVGACGTDMALATSRNRNAGSGSVGIKDTPGNEVKRRSFCWTEHNAGPNAEFLLQKLRWATLGPHFDWTERKYITEVPFKQLPNQLEAIGLRLAGMVGISFKPDAALVNYYYKGSTIGGHKDDAEQDMSQPIVSLSLGCPAVFLMGGESRDIPPTPIFLHTGDAVILSGNARRCFHGVPRVVVGSCQQQLGMQGFGCAHDECTEGLSQILSRMHDTRINISIRNVLSI